MILPQNPLYIIIFCIYCRCCLVLFVRVPLLSGITEGTSSSHLFPFFPSLLVISPRKLVPFIGDQYQKPKSRLSVYSLFPPCQYLTLSSLYLGSVCVHQHLETHLSIIAFPRIHLHLINQPEVNIVGSDSIPALSASFQSFLFAGVLLFSPELTKQLTSLTIASFVPRQYISRAIQKCKPISRKYKYFSQKPVFINIYLSFLVPRFLLHPKITQGNNPKHFYEFVIPFIVHFYCIVSLCIFSRNH